MSAAPGTAAVGVACLLGLSFPSEDAHCDFIQES